MRASWILLLAVACSGRTSGGKEGPNELVSWSDEDGDTILDLDEGFVDPAEGESSDFDADGTPDYQDLDSDEDGIPDGQEAGDTDVVTLPWDSDLDGAADFVDLDSDENCIPDADEGGADPDEDGIGNSADLDDDGDGLTDLWEIGDACAQVDSDGDGRADRLDTDSDGDGASDATEAGTSVWEDTPADTDGDGVFDYLDDDSDGDGFLDSDEAGGGREARDTDGDGTWDGADTDSDGDGIRDADEASYGTDRLDDDSDDDGFTDGAEVAAGTTPTDAGSVIDGIYVTVEERTNLEETFEFTLNVSQGDIGFLLDTTCSMSGTLNSMASEFSTIVSQLSTTVPDAYYAVATFDDYNYGSYGASGDLIYSLEQPVTSSTSDVQSTLSRLSVHNGGDGPEGAMEALYQALAGAGYDMGCDGRYDATKDVRPFLASSSDPFAGSGGENYDAAVPGIGTYGGMGFRAGSLPIVVYVTDNYMRDPDSSNRTYNGSPGGCPGDAGADAVVAAAADQGAYLIGISVSGSLPLSQMQSLAQRTGSYADTDGDGVADDALAFQWSGNASVLRSTIVGAIEDLVDSVQFSELTLEIEGDEWGFVTAVDPETYPLSSEANGQTIEFALTFRGVVAAAETDQVYKLTLNVLGDGVVLLDTLDIYVLVPGRSY
ncbi:MAG: hypothetical protein ACOZNI_00580 [Myxococcota bacterium]